MGGLVIHDAHGWWIAEAGAPAPLPALAGDIDADVVVVGGGYTGLWTAWEIAEAEPNARVVVLEADRCGMGPSGRNGGFLSSLWLYLPLLRGEHGEAAALELCEASVESVRGDRRVVRGPGGRRVAPRGARISSSPAPPARTAPAPARSTADDVVPLTAAETRAVCDSPVFRGGVATRAGATVHPARLAFGLRERLLGRGVRIFEGSAVRALHADRSHPEAPGAMVAETAGGRVRAATAVVAVNAASGRLHRLRNRLTVSSSHIVLTEPVPDVIEALGWTGGEAITDGRALLHYFRTTRDGRILFGWGGGRMAAGARTRRAHGRRPGHRGRRRGAACDRIFPALAGRRIDHAWGGPIDVSPTHLPAIVTLAGGRAWAAFGYTGNGVGPSHLAARSLASLALGRRDDAARWAWIDPPPKTVPPEPLRVAGATVLRAALARSEAAAEAGGRADPVSEALAALPEKLGLHIVR